MGGGGKDGVIRAARTMSSAQEARLDFCTISKMWSAEELSVTVKPRAGRSVCPCLSERPSDCQGPTRPPSPELAAVWAGPFLFSGTSEKD